MLGIRSPSCYPPAPPPAALSDLSARPPSSPETPELPLYISGPPNSCTIEVLADRFPPVALRISRHMIEQVLGSLRSTVLTPPALVVCRSPDLGHMGPGVRPSQGSQ
jgi:hypothetical protein